MRCGREEESTLARLYGQRTLQGLVSTSRPNSLKDFRLKELMENLDVMFAKVAIRAAERATIFDLQQKKDENPQKLAEKKSRQ